MLYCTYMFQGTNCEILHHRCELADNEANGISAARFQVPQTFLLQQAAWLYERHYEHVRSQVNSLKSTVTNVPVTSGSGSRETVVGGIPIQRTTSGGSKGMFM